MRLDFAGAFIAFLLGCAITYLATRPPKCKKEWEVSIMLDLKKGQQVGYSVVIKDTDGNIVPAPEGTTYNVQFAGTAGNETIVPDANDPTKGVVQAGDFGSAGTITVEVDLPGGPVLNGQSDTIETIAGAPATVEVVLGQPEPIPAPAE